MYDCKGRLSRDQQLQQHLPLVKKMANLLKAKLPANVELDDLVQAGLMGLLDALERYEETQQAQFETYAAQRIKGSMLDQLRENDWVPRSLRKQMRQIESAILTLQGQLRRNPTEREIADQLKVSLEEYQSMLGFGAGHQLIYFEDFQSDGDSDHWLDRYCHDDADDPLKLLINSGFRSAVVEAITRLPEREKLVMGLYYEQELNLKEIGAVLGVTESRVSQIHTQAITRMRACLRSLQWSDLAG